jgi:hypothetical protein
VPNDYSISSCDYRRSLSLLKLFLHGFLLMCLILKEKAMKFLLGLVGILAVLFIGGFLFSGMTPAVVTQTEMTRDIEPPKEQVKTPPPVIAAPEPVAADAQAVVPTPDAAPTSATEATPQVTTTPTAVPAPAPTQPTPVTTPTTSPVTNAE